MRAARGERAKRWMWIWLPLAFFLTCLGWALTAPVGSSPDDDYHLASIWCAAGEREGACGDPGVDPPLLLVPRGVAQAHVCYAFTSDVPADCAAPAVASDQLVGVTHVNQIEGLYPGGYYTVMSMLVGPDIERSVIAMRVFNAALASLLLALLIRVVPSGIRQAALLALVATFIPLGFFVVASTNPSGWSVVGLTTFWAFALALLHRSSWRSRRTWLVAAGAVVSAAMAASARVDSAACLVVAAAVVLVVAGFRRLRANWIATVVILGLAGAGVFSYLNVQATPGTGEVMGEAKRGFGLLLSNAANLPSLFQGAVGGWALGWNDTAMPAAVPVLGTLVLGGLAYVGLASMWGRKAWASALAGLALIGVPLAFLQLEGLAVGQVVQPRYVLPLMSFLMAALLLGPRVAEPLRRARTPALAMAAALVISGALAFWANAHRYVVGTGVGLFDPHLVLAWSPPGPPLLVTLTMTVLATSVLVWGVFVLESTRLPVGSAIPARRPRADNVGP